MRYIGDNDASINVTLKTRDFNGIKTDIVVESLENVSSDIERKYNTSRSMWPDKELVGVEFETEEFSGYIKTSEIKLSVDRSDVDEAYKRLREWFESSDLSLPSKQKFLVQSFTFHTDDLVLSVDETKCTNKQNLVGFEYVKNGITSNYSVLQGMVSYLITEPDEGISISKFDDYVGEIIGDEIIIIGDEDEMVDKSNEDRQ